ncbi:MAG: efflux transporter outer membrane subunit [Nitrosospira sp.]|nr:efflux transporter outer membrane subunit [Nitrosospira sp.]
MKLQPSMPLVLLSLLLSSCAMGPDYARPKIETADNFRMAEIEGESIANLPWWELLHDEQLQLLIRQALAENKDLKQAVASMEEFQARIFMARSDFLPGINVSTNAPAFGTLGGFVVPGFPTPFSYFGQGTLNWEIDIWGRVRRANEAARADLLAREENRRAVVLTLVSGVAQSYFDLLQLDMQLEITRRTLLSWEETVALSQHRLRGGVISRLDADQFEAERANVSARLAEIERQVIQKENELNVLLGKNPAPISRGRLLTDQVMLLEVPAGLPSDLLQRRPDILQAEQALAAATARIGMTKAARFPRITLTGLLGVASPRLANLLTSGSEFGMGGVGLAGPLLNAQTLGHEQRAFEAQSRRVLAQYEQTILVAFKEVEDSLVAVRTAKNQRKAQQEQVDALRSALQIANLRHQAGITSHLEVLVAKRSLFSAETALTSAHRLHLVSVVQLYKALGGGWSPG